MQKAKRIKEWGHPDGSCGSRSSATALPTTTAAIHRPTLTTTTIKSAASIWTKEPQTTGNYCLRGCSTSSNNNNNNNSNLSSNKQRTCVRASQRHSGQMINCCNSENQQNQLSGTTMRPLPSSAAADCWWLSSATTRQPLLLLLIAVLISVATLPAAVVRAELVLTSTQSLRSNASADTPTAVPVVLMAISNGTTGAKRAHNTRSRTASLGDSIFMQIAKRFPSGNELWDGIIHDCYQRPSFSCFQKNVYTYLNDALDARDVNVTQRFKFYRNAVHYQEQAEEPEPADSTTEKAADATSDDTGGEEEASDEHLLHNEIPHRGRAAAADTPIEEVTNALYGKSVKFVMTHDVEVKLPEMMFDGATFRISPRSIEGNGIIAKLELIPKQVVEARLAGKIIKKKIQKFLRNKVLLSFIALVLIIKIIKIKLFWLLPLVIGIGAAKKLLLKFLLFLFPALSHLFKLCSYYQQTYHSTKYHHHHHLINHHHTIVPPWHSGEHSSVPEIIYTSPPKGHISAYLHGAPIHETYGPPSYEHNEGAWENSGPGLGSEYIGDINRVAQIEGNSNYFAPHKNDAAEIHNWGLGTTSPTAQKKQRLPATQQQRPPTMHNTQSLTPPQLHQQKPPPPPPSPSLYQEQQQQQQHPQNYQKPQTTSHSFNPFLSPEKQSFFSSKLKGPVGAQSMPSPVYVPQRNGGNANAAPPPPGAHAAQIAAQYDPTRGNVPQQPQQQQQQQQLSPQLSAQVQEALRIQAEQRLIAQQQKILEHQPFVQDGQPIYPKNYDPFYSPLLLKIDKIVEQLGVTDDLCKERLVCSMYRDPARYSPHSNFVSAELSRDTSELEPVTNSNQAVIRFYRLIQAARDGQDQKDCLRLYPQCTINTE